MGPLHLAIVLGCAALVLSADEPKKCPDITTIGDFKVDKYLGLWYEIQKTENVQSLPGKCISARYNELKDGAVEVINSMCIFDKKFSIVGNATEESKGSVLKGQLSVSLGNTKRPYYVLDTDYDSYSIVYSCQVSTNPQQGPDRSLWVLGKETKLNDTQKEKVTKKIEALGLTDLTLTVTDQTNCCYDATKYDDGSSAASIGFSMALLLSTVMVRFL